MIRIVPRNGPSTEVGLGPTITSFSPSVVDTAGGSTVRVLGSGFSNLVSASIGGVACTSFDVVDDETVDIVSAAMSAGMKAISLEGEFGTTITGSTCEAWSPAQISGARLFDASHGVTSTGSTVGSQWTKVSDELSEDWIWRDGTSIGYLAGKWWMIAGTNGDPPPNGFGVYPSTGTGPSTNEVWSSSDGGATWTLELEDGHTQFTRRHTQGFVVWNNKMWIVGGDQYAAGGYHRDVLSSANGTTWTTEVATTPWSERMLSAVGVYDGKLWLFGGQNGIRGEASGDVVYHNDVWNSADGVTWTQIAADGAASATRPGPRGLIFGLVEFLGRMWLVSGGKYPSAASPSRVYYAEVWSTTDGITWTQHASPPWIGKLYHDVSVFGGRLWMLGGYNDTTIGNTNDVWSTADGETWEQSPADTVIWPVSHADGFGSSNAPYWLRGGGSSSGVVEEGRAVYRWDTFPGAHVTAWEDRGDDGLIVSASGTKRPVVCATAINGRPGIVFDGSDDVLALASKDSYVAGWSVFWLGRAPWMPDRISHSAYSPRETVVGDNTGGQYSAFGVENGALKISNYGGGWNSHTAGSGLSNAFASFHVCGWTHDVTGDAKAYIDGLNVGTTGSVGYDVGGAGWRAIGAGFGESDHYRGVLGFVLVVPSVLSGSDVEKLSEWASGRFGV